MAFPSRPRPAAVPDVAEAYLVDLPRPVKKRLSAYEMMETAIAKVIAR